MIMGWGKGIGWCPRCQSQTNCRIDREETQEESRKVVRVVTTCSRCHMSLRTEIKEVKGASHDNTL